MSLIDVVSISPQVYLEKRDEVWKDKIGLDFNCSFFVESSKKETSVHRPALHAMIVPRAAFLKTLEHCMIYAILQVEKKVANIEKGSKKVCVTNGRSKKMKCTLILQKIPISSH